MKLRCPSCKADFTPEGLDLTKDVALCKTCGEAFVMSKLVRDAEVLDETRALAPTGAWLERTADGFRLGASTRSAAAAVFVPATLAWLGYLGPLVLEVLTSGRYGRIGWIFAASFVSGAILLAIGSLMTTFGKVQLEVTGEEAVAFTGVGRIGVRRRLAWASIESVEDLFAALRSGAASSKQVAKQRARATALDAEGQRLRFLAQSAERLIAERRQKLELEAGTLAIAADVGGGALSTAQAIDGALSPVEPVEGALGAADDEPEKVRTRPSTATVSIE